MLPLINYSSYDWKQHCLFGSLDPQEMKMH